jgi:hypothetical protein
MSTEVLTCIDALMKREKGGLTSVLKMKIPRPAALGGEPSESGVVAASV